MRKHLFIILFGISFYLFGQENTYRFLYDIHQETIFNDEMKKNTPKDFLPEIVNAFNESYEFEVLASKNYSFVKLIEKVKNSQNDAVRIYPEPNWLLNDFEHNKSYEFAEYGDTYVVDSIKIEGLKPTKEMKEILGLQAKKFIFENGEFYQSPGNDYSSHLAMSWNGSRISMRMAPVSIGNDLEALIIFSSKTLL